MPYTIAQASDQLAVHRTTVRRQIRSGKLRAELLDGRWVIHDDAIAQEMKQAQRSNHGVGNGYSGPDAALTSLLEHQLEEKDRQIRELHVLLQAAQEQRQRTFTGPVPKRLRSWWPF